MAVARAEDQVFFIYDHTSIKSETDDLKDAIVYFFPSSIGINSQCALVGQLMGMVDFFKSFTGSPPLVFTLQCNKVAIKHLGKYTLALAGNRVEPDGVVLTQLDYLHKLFVLYQGSLQHLEKAVHQRDSTFSEVTQDIWDCYLPFIRRYGDNVAAAFESLPVVDLPETGSTLFLKATHLLQKCQKDLGSLAGCLLYRNRVLCSQFHPDITARLLILRPRQTHFPCIFLNTDVNPPAEIRLLKIFLTSKEKDFLTGGQQRATSTSHNSQKNHNVASTPEKPISKDDKLSLTEVHNDKAKRRRSNQTHTRKFGSVDWNNTIQEFKSLAKDTADLGSNVNKIEPQQTMATVSEVVMDTKNDSLLSVSTTQIPKSHSESDIISSTEVPKHVEEKDGDPIKSDSSVPSYGRQVSQESNILCVENDTAQNDQNSSKLSVCNAASRSNSAPGSRPLKYRNNGSQPQIGNTMSLLQNIKRIAAQSRNILEDINRKMDLNSDMKDSDDEAEHSNARYHSQSGLTNELGDVAVGEECTEQLLSYKEAEGNNFTSTVKSEASQDVVPVNNDDTNDSEMLSESVLSENQSVDLPKILDEPRDGDLKSGSQDEDFEHLSINDPDEVSQCQQEPDNMSDESLASDTKASPHLTYDLCEQDLYIQSGNDILLVLMMEKDHLMDGHLVNNIWRTYASQLKELDNQLHQISDVMANKKEVPTTYNYLTYNSYTKNLSGKISMTRGMLQPMSHHELDFCGTAVAMHQQFCESKDLTDMTLRSHSSFVYGHRNFSQEMYFQPKECKPPTGIPSARDTTMCLDPRTGLALLREQGIHLI